MTQTSELSQYEQRVEQVRQQLADLPPDVRPRLRKKTSNLFRPRALTPGTLDASLFDGVLCIDVAARTADVGGMTSYENLVAATLQHGLLPLVVPELKTITLGGAVTGLGIESSSFRNGCPHESVLEMDILTGDGQVVTATPDNEHRDLFFAFPNSYGSLGYALRLRIELEEVKPFVHLRHLRFDRLDDALRTVDSIVEERTFDGESVDFLDGTWFSAQECYLTLGSYAGTAPTLSDYTGRGIYYRSIQQPPGSGQADDWLGISDYIWRWDTDWFWCSRAFGAQNPTLRRLWPRRWRRSDVYWKLVALNRRTGFADRLERRRGNPAREEVVQDIEVPLARAAEFVEYLSGLTGIEPVWLCPLRQRDPSRRWDLYVMDPNVTYVNIGFWSTAALPAGESGGYFNRQIEAKVAALGGRKSLYSMAFYPREQFWNTYGGATYFTVKEKYDPAGRLLDLYDKTVTGR